MIEAYKIGVSLIVDSNAGKAVGNLADQFKALDLIIQRIQGSVNEMAGAMRVMSRMADGTAAAWAKTAAVMERAAKAASRASAGFSGGTGASSGGGNSGGGQSFSGPSAPGPRASRPTLALPFFPNNPVPPSKGAIGGGGAPPLRLGGPGIPLGPVPAQPGGSMRIGGVEMLEAVGFYEAFKLAMNEELNLTIAAIDLGFRKGSPGFEEVAPEIRTG